MMKLEEVLPVVNFLFDEKKYPYKRSRNYCRWDGYLGS